MEGKQHEQPRSRPSARARSEVRPADFSVTHSLAARWQVLCDIWLRHLFTAFGTLNAAQLPHRVRITLRQGTVRAGEHITLTVRLMPPLEPARPVGYDFARDAFFRGIGAVGSGLGTIERASPPWPAPFCVRVNAAINEARNAMTERIARLIEGGKPGLWLPRL